MGRWKIAWRGKLWGIDGHGDRRTGEGKGEGIGRGICELVSADAPPPLDGHLARFRNYPLHSIIIWTFSAQLAAFRRSPMRSDRRRSAAPMGSER